MIVLGLDFESTGLDTSTARIIEVGAVAWDTEKKAPIAVVSEFILEPAALPLPPEIIALTGIHEEWLLTHGHPLPFVIELMTNIVRRCGIEYIVAHNGENYDKPLLDMELIRHGYTGSILTCLPWIDTRQDLPHEKEPDSRKLKHLALDQGFINPFPHRAFTDVLTMLKVMSAFDFNVIAENSKIPWITVRAMTGYEDRQKAKDARFSWEEAGGKKWPKAWVKRIRETQLDLEKANGTKNGFDVVRIE